MEEEVLRQIDLYDTISFDIFDTLIMRRTLYPHDIFSIVEKKAKREGIVVPSFYQSRIQAEQDLIAKIPDIYALYEQVQRLTGISAIERDRLMELELETEHRNILRRERVCRLLDRLHEKGKRIFLLSDMYIPKKILLDWMRELGITGAQEAFISCTYHRPKVDGLYEIYKRAVQGERYLHIGDNEIYDGRYARAAGIDPFLIKSASAGMEGACPFAVAPFKEREEDRAALGLLAAGLFADPFSDGEGEKIQVRQLGELVGHAVAPMVSGLALWLIRKLLEGGYDGLLLAARDGYLLQKMLRSYETIRGERLPFYHYLYTSRAACAVASIGSQEAFMQAVRRPSTVSFGACVEERLGIPADGQQDPERFYQENKEQIIARSSELKGRYQRYAADLKLASKGRYAFFDFVSSGTCLSMLEKILGMKMTGLFCYHYHAAPDKEKELDIESFLDEAQGKRFWDYYKIFEAILTSPDGSFLRFDADGRPRFAEDMRPEMEMELVKEMQEQVLEYWSCFLELGVDSPPSPELLLHMAELFDSKGIVLSDRKKDSLYLYDSFEGGKIKVFP